MQNMNVKSSDNEVMNICLCYHGNKMSLITSLAVELDCPRST